MREELDIAETGYNCIISRMDWFISSGNYMKGEFYSIDITLALDMFQEGMKRFRE